jgi:hypothetical protein
LFQSLRQRDLELDAEIGDGARAMADDAGVRVAQPEVPDVRHLARRGDAQHASADRSALLVLNELDAEEVDPRIGAASEVATHAHDAAANTLARALVGEGHALDDGDGDLGVHHTIHLKHPHRRRAPCGHVDGLALLLMAAPRRERRRVADGESHCCVNVRLRMRRRHTEAPVVEAHVPVEVLGRVHALLIVLSNCEAAAGRLALRLWRGRAHARPRGDGDDAVVLEKRRAARQLLERRAEGRRDAQLALGVREHLLQLRGPLGRALQLRPHDYKVADGRLAFGAHVGDRLEGGLLRCRLTHRLREPRREALHAARVDADWPFGQDGSWQELIHLRGKLESKELVGCELRARPVRRERLRRRLEVRGERSLCGSEQVSCALTVHLRVRRLVSLLLSLSAAALRPAVARKRLLDERSFARLRHACLLEVGHVGLLLLRAGLGVVVHRRRHPAPRASYRWQRLLRLHGRSEAGRPLAARPEGGRRALRRRHWRLWAAVMAA